MPPKPTKKKGPDVSKKNLQKKKLSSIEDQTFGLKNKNKSKVVQRKVQAIQKSVYNGGDKKVRAADDLRARMKSDNKMRKKAMEDERNSLFGEALMAIKSKSSTSKTSGKIEAKGRDADEENKKSGTSRAMKMMFQMDAQEMEQRLKEDPNYVPTLEDEIESQRQTLVAELKASGKGTPVNPETFAAWQETKKKRKADVEKKLVEAELKKKKGGKGLAVLTGRALYEYKRELFMDDEAATDGLEFGDDDTDGNNGDDQKTPAADTVTVDEVADQVHTELTL